MDARSPVIKKKRTGRVSPRSLFALIKDERDARTDISYTKPEMNSNKNSNGWKPPLKSDSQCNELWSSSGSTPFQIDNENLRREFNSEPIIKGTLSDCDMPPYHNNSSSPCRQSIIENDSLGSMEEENIIEENPSDSESNKLINYNNSQSVNPDQREERPFDTLPYIDYCIEKEEGSGKDISSDIIKEDLDKFNEQQDINSKENREIRNDKDMPTEFHSCYSQVTLKESKTDDSQRIQSDSEEFSLDLTGNKNNEDLINDELNYLNNPENMKYFSQTSKQSTPSNLLNKSVIDESSVSANIYKNIKPVINEQDGRTQIIEQVRRNYCSSQENKCTDEGSTNNKYIKNFATQSSSSEHNDPFEVTISNSQFLRLEKEISSADQHKYLEPLTSNIETIDRETRSMATQIEQQKNILRKIINEVNELNKAVVNATSYVRKLSNNIRK